MKTSKRVTRRVTKTATIGLVALALAVGGTLALPHTGPANPLGGDRLIKMGAPVDNGSGCFDKGGASQKGQRLEKGDRLGAGSL